MNKKITLKERKNGIDLKTTKHTEAVDGVHMLSTALIHLIKKYSLVKDKKDFLRIIGMYYDDTE